MEQVRVLGRSLFECHLASIASRSREANSQQFAHRLAEKEICPDLLPQTGASGGGDRKVDSETYPVADDLALIWCDRDRQGGGQRALGIGSKCQEEAAGQGAARSKDWVLIDAPSGGDVQEPDWFKQERRYKPHDFPGEVLDLRTDTAERDNLYGDYPEVVQKLSRILMQAKLDGHAGSPSSVDITCESE